MSSNPAPLFLRIAEGPEDVAPEQRSLTRTICIILVLTVLVLATLLAASSAVPDNPIWKPEAALAAHGDDGDDDDHGDSDSGSSDSASNSVSGSGSASGSNSASVSATASASASASDH